ncbi:acyltransferase family protein [Glacieibacterium frigidum]|uniref:Acyltransferase n=1 Tax=Glacieibacterium frigidum TaxID=2593303 RepID=A0A552UGY6_9SPHN|nr:acyltransferase [Glacieibacterium frigidum]TRW17437.1 acyltransferase [Glacieibacterium frigidum]
MIPGVRRFAALDALRGLCACLVCLFHFRANSSVADAAFIRQSWQFVDFFFVLSGFVIAANYRDRLAAHMPTGQFMLLRLGRIYPLHAFMLAVFVATELTALALGSGGAAGRALFDEAHSARAILSNLLLIQSVGFEDRLTWNQPAWSIAVEIWAYLLFALAVRAFGRGLDAALVVVVVVAPLLLFALAGSINVSFDYGLIRCVYGFALGVLCWSIWGRWGDALLARARGWTALEIAAGGAVALFVTYAGPTAWNLLGPPLFAAALLVFAREGGAVSRALATPVPLLLGTLSYSIYMVHSFVQSRFDDVLLAVERLTGTPLTTRVVDNGPPEILAGADPVQGVLLTILMLAVVVAVSWLTYRFVEVPAQRWSRRAADPGRTHVRG